jgi:hypothetical protein
VFTSDGVRKSPLHQTEFDLALPGKQGGYRSQSNDIWIFAEVREVNLEQRLSVYGLAEQHALTEAIVVPPGVKLTLVAPVHSNTAAVGHQKQNTGYNKLFPKSMEEVKRWVGVSDHVGKQSNSCCYNLSDIAFVNSPEELRHLSAAQLQTLYKIARAYVYGDSTSVKSYLPAIDHLVAKISVAGLIGLFSAKDIDVLPKGILEISPSIKILFANNIRIWKGAAVYLDSATKIDCASIVGQYHEIHIPKVSEVSLLNSLGKTVVVAEAAHV